MKLTTDNIEPLTEAVETICKLADVINALCDHLPEDKRKRIRSHLVQLARDIQALEDIQ